jgi:hypothetical protein
MTNVDLGITLAVLFVALAVASGISRRRERGRTDPPFHDAGAVAVGTFVVPSGGAGCDSGGSIGGDCGAS